MGEEASTQEVAPRRRLWKVLMLALVAVPVVVFMHWRAYVSSPIEAARERAVEVEIPAGEGFQAVSQRLVHAKLVDNLLYFKVLARLQGDDKRIRAGIYVVEPGSSPSALLAALTAGGADQSVTLTVPEGKTIFDIADLVDKKKLASREEFLKRAQDPALRQKFSVGGESMEGFLFPDTYKFSPGCGADAVLERLYKRHKAVWDEIVEDVGKAQVQKIKNDYNLSLGELVTLASIVEREAVVDQERPVIARVFLNRVKKEMRLQADPTCTYGPKIYTKKASPKLCKDKQSRYSTYVIKGLPPGPIANPGRSSLRAVVAPTTDKDKVNYLYFVAKPDGRHHTFSETYKAHKKAIPR